MTRNGSTSTAASGNGRSNGGSNGRSKARAEKSAKKGRNGSDLLSRFYGIPLPGVKPEELSGSLIVVEGTDGSGRSTQISLLTEWLESEGFAVQTMGLRRSFLVGEDIDALLAENTVTRMTLALMYSTDFFDQLERRILAGAAFGVDCAGRPLYFHADRARGGPRDRAGLPARDLRNRAAAGSDVLAQRAAGSRVRPRIQEIADDQLLGVGPRHVAFERSLPVVHPLPIDDQARIRISVEAARLHRNGRRRKRLRREPGAAQAHRFAPRHPQHALQAFARTRSTSGANEWPPRYNWQRSTLDRTPSGW